MEPNDDDWERALIHISGTVWIGENEVQESFIRSSGAGGQNINKVETAVQVRFDALGSVNLPPHAYGQLKVVAGRRLSRSGILILTAQRFRTQERNRADAMERLLELLREAVKPPPPNRRATRPTWSSVKRRLNDKASRSATKSKRKVTASDALP